MPKTPKGTVNKFGIPSPHYSVSTDPNGAPTTGPIMADSVLVTSHTLVKLLAAFLRFGLAAVHGRRFQKAG